jgi:hypothetical protein
LTARIGGSGFGSVMAVRRIVPSPPNAITKSAFISESGTNVPLAAILPARVFSIYTFKPLPLRLTSVNLNLYMGVVQNFIEKEIYLW